MRFGSRSPGGRPARTTSRARGRTSSWARSSSSRSALQPASVKYSRFVAATSTSPVSDRRSGSPARSSAARARRRFGRITPRPAKSLRSSGSWSGMLHYCPEPSDIGPNGRHGRHGSHGRDPPASPRAAARRPRPPRRAAHAHDARVGRAAGRRWHRDVDRARLARELAARARRSARGAHHRRRPAVRHRRRVRANPAAADLLPPETTDAAVRALARAWRSLGATPVAEPGPELLASVV